jgi:hypothetical protein
MFIGFGIISLLIWGAKIFIGIGLVYGCARGLLTQEWVYDAESAKLMNRSQWIGLALGVFLVANALGFVSLPIPFFGGGWGFGLTGPGGG